MTGPTPAEARAIIDELVATLMSISLPPRDGGPATLAAARRQARDVCRALPRNYRPRDDEWRPA